MKKIKLSENFMIKLLSIALAITLWMYVQGQQPQSIHEGIQTFKDVEIEWTTDSGYIVTAITSRTADVTIAGSIETINLLSEEDILIDLDLTGYNKGRHSISLEPFIPAGIRVFNISPSQVDVVLDSWEEKIMEVEVEYINDLPENAVVVEESIEPNEVVISGAEDLVDDVESVVIEYNYETMDEQEVGISLKAKNDTGVTLSNVNIDEFVDVTIIIEYSKTLPVRLNSEVEIPEDTTVRLQPNNAIAVGPRDLIDELEYLETEYFNIGEVEQERFEIDLIYPENIKPFNEQHQNVEVIIE